MRAFISYGVALAIIAVIAVWMGTGSLIQGGQGPNNGERPVVSLVEPEGGPVTDVAEQFAPEHHDDEHIDPALTIAERNDETTGGAEAKRSVRIKSYTMASLPLEVSLRGRTKAGAIVSASAETNGIVQEVHVKKGQTVAEGDLLCTLDPSTRAAAVKQAEAAVAQANASLTQAKVAYDTNASLREKGLAPANSAEQVTASLAAAEAGLQSAQTGLDNAKAELDRTTIRAKIGGVIQSPITDAGAMLSPGQACATIAQLDPMLFIGNVPEARIGLARTGLEATVTTVSGQSATGEVTYISSLADNATRSFPIEIELPNADGRILDGLTAEAEVTLGTIPAHLLPQSVLTLDDDGVLGVKSVEDGEVVFHEITIVSDTRDGVWVTGLPLQVDIITLGQEYVTTGQAVDARAVESGAEGSAS